MDTREAYDDARRLLTEHGLHDWRVELDRARRRAGACRFGDRVISLSGPLTRLHDPEVVRETILHEIAHALAGPKVGHGPRWRETARRLGCSTDRCLPPDAPRVPGAWVGTCPGGHVIARHRRPDRVATCRECSHEFSLEHVFEWTHHGRPGAMHPTFVAELESLRQGTSTRLLPVGASVRVVVPGRFCGVVGTVEKRGRTRYHLRVHEGVLAVAFAGVEPA